MARDRYLWNAGEDTIHDPSKEQKITTKKQKRENFWFYHKWHIVICVVCAALVGLFLYDMLNQENPDYEIAFLTDSAYMKTDIERIKNQITSVADDKNGDGEVLVTINEYIVSGNGNGQVEMAAMARVINDLSNYESVIYIMDENNLAEEQSQNPSLFAYADGSIPPADETDYSNIGVLWKDCPLLTSIDLTSEVQLQDGKTQIIDSQKVFEDLRVCIRSRNFDETNTETAQKYEDNWNLYQKITGISS